MSAANSTPISEQSGALQPIISATRVLALAHNIAAINTDERLLALADQGVVRTDHARACSEAFAIVQLQGMTLNQQQAEHGLALNNGLNVDDLNPLDQRILREAMRQTGRLQQRLNQTGQSFGICPHQPCRPTPP